MPIRPVNTIFNLASGQTEPTITHQLSGDALRDSGATIDSTTNHFTSAQGIQDVITGVVLRERIHSGDVTSPLEVTHTLTAAQTTSIDLEDVDGITNNTVVVFGSVSVLDANGSSVEFTQGGNGNRTLTWDSTQTAGSVFTIRLREWFVVTATNQDDYYASADVKVSPNNFTATITHGGSNIIILKNTPGGGFSQEYVAGDSVDASDITTNAVVEALIIETRRNG